MHKFSMREQLGISNNASSSCTAITIITLVLLNIIPSIILTPKLYNKCIRRLATQTNKLNTIVLPSHLTETYVQLAIPVWDKRTSQNYYAFSNHLLRSFVCCLKFQAVAHFFSFFF